VWRNDGEEIPANDAEQGDVADGQAAAHFKTLRVVRGSSVNAPASWTAASGRFPPVNHPSASDNWALTSAKAAFTSIEVVFTSIKMRSPYGNESYLPTNEAFFGRWKIEDEDIEDERWGKATTRIIFYRQPRGATQAPSSLSQVQNALAAMSRRNCAPSKWIFATAA
jgi:hypothetical protein